MTRSKFSIFFFLVAVVLGAAACDSDDDGGSGSDAGSRDGRGRDVTTGTDIPGLDVGVGTDTGSGDSGGSLTCDDIPTNAEAGTACTGAEGECANGFCISDGADGATCSQVCVPGTCEAMCTGGERCLPVADSDGNPIEIEPGVDLGVCGTPVTGDQGAYEACSQEIGACDATADCLLLNQGDTVGQCLPRCTGGLSCPTLNGLSGSCSVTGGSDQYCVAQCTTPGSDECGAGFDCVDTGQGINICSPE